MYMSNFWRVRQTQGTSEKTVVHGVYINPLPGRNDLKTFLWGV